MAIKNKKREVPRGFTLIIAIIFMAVMLAFGLALGSLSYKQQVLASSAIESQYAFYAADAGLECTLYADQQFNLFAYPQTDPTIVPGFVPPGITCDTNGGTPYSSSGNWSPTQWVVTNSLSLDSNTRCVDVTVYKPNPTNISPALTNTYIFSQGYDVPCATVKGPPQVGSRFVARGINIRY